MKWGKKHHTERRLVLFAHKIVTSSGAKVTTLISFPEAMPEICCHGYTQQEMEPHHPQGHVSGADSKWQYVLTCSHMDTKIEVIILHYVKDISIGLN